MIGLCDVFESLYGVWMSSVVPKKRVF